VARAEDLRARRGLRLRIRRWGEEYAALDEASGDIHLFSPQVVSFLKGVERLSGSPPIAWDGDDVSDLPAAVPGTPEGEDPVADELRRQLLRLGLVELATP
jgi:hypothetical protein